MREFKCKRCGYCCSLKVRLGMIDLFKITRLGYKADDFSEKDKEGRTVIKLINGDCYFLGRTGNKPFCKIYNARPKVCRNFPSEEQIKMCGAYKDMLI